MRTPSRASSLSSRFRGPAVNENARGGGTSPGDDHQSTLPSEQRQDSATSPAPLLRGLIATAVPRVDAEAERRKARADYNAKTESRRVEHRGQLDQLRSRRAGEGGAT
jgi:hypothetical protein